MATGQSLTEKDASYAQEKSQVIVVNDAWRVVHDAPYHYACDAKWWDLYYQEVKAGFQGQSFTIDDDDRPDVNPKSEYDLVRLKSKHGEGLSKEFIHYGLPRGGNSGYQAVNLAYQLGAKTILLLGFDMHGTHYFGKHPDGLVQGSPFQKFIESFKTIRGVEIINCSPGSALTCFPNMRIQDVI